jgi:putative two-component system response regulator
MKKRALIVEDDHWLAESFKLILSEAGWQTLAAKNGKEAIDIIDETPPNVILLDVLLPEVNAFALLHELQSYTDTHSIPVIICTTLNQHQLDAESLKNYGVVEVLNKTELTPASLVSVLEKAT